MRTTLRATVKVTIDGSVVRLPVLVACEWQSAEPDAGLHAGWVPVEITGLDMSKDAHGDYLLVDAILPEIKASADDAELREHPFPVDCAD